MTHVMSKELFKLSSTQQVRSITTVWIGDEQNWCLSFVTFLKPLQPQKYFLEQINAFATWWNTLKIQRALVWFFKSRDASWVGHWRTDDKYTILAVALQDLFKKNRNKNQLLTIESSWDILLTSLVIHECILLSCLSSLLHWYAVNF